MKGIITLENMPDEYIQLKGELLYIIIDNIQKILSLRKFSKFAGIRYGKILKFHYRKNRLKSVKISDLELIINFLNSYGKIKHDLDELKIASIGKYRSVISPKFPINFNTLEGISFIADLLTDGSLHQRNYVSYTNNEPLQILHNLKCVNKFVCKHDIKIKNQEYVVLKKHKNAENTLKTLKSIAKRSKVTCNVNLKQKYPSPTYSIRYTDCLGKILIKLGIPKGKRVYTNPSLPNFTSQMPSNFIFRFLERIIVNEGWVSKTKICIFHGIDVTNKIPMTLKEEFLDSKTSKREELKRFLETNRLEPNLIKDYSRLLKKLGCKTSSPYVKNLFVTKKNKIRSGWVINITGKNLDILKNNFEINTELNKKLLPLLRRNFMKHPMLRRERLQQIMGIARELKRFKSKDITKRINLGLSTTISYINELVKENKLKLIGKGSKTTYFISQ